jgi:hypothetical protein
MRQQIEILFIGASTLFLKQTNVVLTFGHVKLDDPVYRFLTGTTLRFLRMKTPEGEMWRCLRGLSRLADLLSK